MSYAPSRRRLSKSRFVAGWQCHKLLWLKVHEPDAPELQPDAVLEDLFDQGRQVGELARERFAGGVLINLPYDAVRERVAATRAALDAGALAVFEASLQADDTYAAVDVLVREDSGFTLVEVKSSTKVKDQHVPDAAVQTHVARRNGLDVRRVEIMHLNPEFRHPDQGELFVRSDITGAVEALLPDVPDAIAAQLAILSAPEQPEVPIGPHCWQDPSCPFWDRCWPSGPDHVTSLYRAVRAKKLQLVEEGHSRIVDLPPTMRLNPIQQRQRRALTEGRMIVEPSLRQALTPFAVGRLGFLDFETVSRAIPVWRGLAPWQAVAVQFSYHERQPEGGYRHVAWLAGGPDDPREELARHLLDATAGAEKIVMYTSFERTRIRELAEQVPDLAGELIALQSKLVDLLPVLQNHVYHPGFAGSFSLKNTLTPLVPDLTYDDLAIVEGQQASVDIARLLFAAHKVEDRDLLRRDLLAYCERDTWALVRLLERLRELVG